MKFYLTLLSMFMVSYLNAQQSNSLKSTKKGLKFIKTEINRGDISYGNKDLFVFEFINTSKKPISIKDVQTSCGCTTADKPAGLIKKRGKGKISVSYDTYRVGPFTKTITVTATDCLPVVLTISGLVLPEKP